MYIMNLKKLVEKNLFNIYLLITKKNLYFYTGETQPKAIKNDLINNEKSKIKIKFLSHCGRKK